MTLPFNFTFSIVLASPFIMAGTDASGVGIDTPALRDETGRPVLPGDHLKGLLREALKRLEDANSPLFQVNGGATLTVAGLFGAEASDPLVPNRGRLRIRDLTADTAPLKKRDITRIEIEDDTGAVKTGALQVVELVAPLGAHVTFKGTAIFYGSQAEVEKLEKLLAAGLRMIASFGGACTSGFGEHISTVSSVEQSDRPSVFRNIASSISTPPPSKWPSDAKRATIIATFDTAFMADVTRAADNIYVGGTVVPGAAIKGALVDMLRRAGYKPEDMTSDFGKAFAALHVSHAFPLTLHGSDEVEADLPIPFSIMRAAGDVDDFRCALGSKHPGVIDDVCADFQPDWKYSHLSRARNLAGRPESNIRKLMRGHTAINAKGVADDQKLFIEVLRASQTKEGVPLRFRFTVDASAAAGIDSKAAKLFCDVLEHEIDGLGKTHAVFACQDAVFACQKVAAIPEASVAPTGTWRICLETPAVLIDADASGQYASVEEALTDYFKAELPTGAHLVDHFVRRRLVGGYAVQRSSKAKYLPISLFEPGSCFLITAEKADPETVAGALAKLVAGGLRVLENNGGRLEPILDWMRMPYLPTNGYGRISVEGAAFTAFDRITGAAP